MLPCVLVLATFAQPVPTPYGVWGQFAGLPSRGGPSSYASPYSAVFLWGEPSFARRVQLPPKGDGVTFDPLPLLEELKRPQPAPATPPDPTAERIKAVEGLILELKARSGPVAVIEQLQLDLDELKATQKKAK